MNLNINTATNAELKKEAERLKEEYKKIQQEVIEKWKILYTLSEDYSKITQMLNKREGKVENDKK